MNKRRWTIWLDDDDRAILARLRRRYGQPSDAATIRLALRLADEQGKDSPSRVNETGAPPAEDRRRD